jgi:hypothetical protein
MAGPYPIISKISSRVVVRQLSPWDRSGHIPSGYRFWTLSIKSKKTVLLMKKIPRRGRDNVPWLWRIDTCPTDIDKDYISREFSARLNTMDTLCDKEHNTAETAATLFLEYVVQWLETGGKCHIFGFIMSPYSGHLANYSIGRGVKQQHADGSTTFIKPGAHMQSGWKVLSPSSIHDYDITRRTIIIESWKANTLRFDWPVSSALIPTLEAAVLDIADETEWYNGVGQFDDYTDVPLPKSYRDCTSWFRMYSDTASVVACANEYSNPDEVSDDPELEALVNREAQVASIMDSDALDHIIDEDDQ